MKVIQCTKWAFVGIVARSIVHHSFWRNTPSAINPSLKVAKGHRILVRHAESQNKIVQANAETSSYVIQETSTCDFILSPGSESKARFRCANSRWHAHAHGSCVVCATSQPKLCQARSLWPVKQEIITYVFLTRPCVLNKCKTQYKP